VDSDARRGLCCHRSRDVNGTNWRGLRGRGVTRTARLNDSKFWTSRFYASAAWTFKDSGATNIAALGTAVGALLATGGTLTSLFPKIDLNPFIIMNVACGGMVAAAPLLFGVANVMFSRRYPIAPADAAVTLTADTSMTVPSGANLSVPGGAVINAAGGQETARVKARGTIPVPPGSKLTVGSGAAMGLPSGYAVAIGPGGTLIMDTDTWIAAGDLAPAHLPARRRADVFGRRRQASAAADTRVEAGHAITVTTGAVATMVGAADIRLAAGTTILAPGHRTIQLKTEAPIVVPSNPNVIGAGMRSLLSAAALTTFGIGTEIGLVAVLAIYFSGATGAGRITAWAISAVVAVGLVLYGATAIRALADPPPDRH
jgi:hypothetical protein